MVMLKTIVLFAGPALSIPLGDPLMSLVDTVCIGQFASTLELAALGPNTLIFQFATYAVAALATACTWCIHLSTSICFILCNDIKEPTNRSSDMTQGDRWPCPMKLQVIWWTAQTVSKREGCIWSVQISQDHRFARRPKLSGL